MRKSREVPITLLAALAAILSSTAGCSQDESRNCVDSQGRILPDSYCGSSSGIVGGPHYVYGGSSGGHVGDTVVGGSTESHGVGFGGFGEHGGFGGEGGE
jgi:hypothetical protein